MFSETEIPLICTPLTGKTTEEIIAELTAILAKKPDLLEWRVDFFSAINETDKVIAALEKIHEHRNGIPLLFTIRSQKEGGQAIPLDEKQIVELLCRIAESPIVDIIDYEVMNRPELVQQVKEASKQHGKKLLLSFHNFAATPSKQELLELFMKMEANGADIAKAAVMPQSKKDVQDLLEATREANNLLGIPVATMSMGELGAMSRMIGWYYGSAITFAVGHKSSAPGQIPIETMRSIIHSLQKPVNKRSE